MDQIEVTIGKRLRQTRKEFHKTQEDVADILEVKRQAYSAYERDRSLPDAKTLVKLADLFGTSVDYLVGRVDDPVDYRAYDKQESSLTPSGYELLTPDNQLRVEGYIQALLDEALEEKAQRAERIRHKYGERDPLAMDPDKVASRHTLTLHDEKN